MKCHFCYRNDGYKVVSWDTVTAGKIRIVVCDKCYQFRINGIAHNNSRGWY